MGRFSNIKDLLFRDGKGVLFMIYPCLCVGLRGSIWMSLLPG
jgi:hypothetical protein